MNVTLIRILQFLVPSCEEENFISYVRYMRPGKSRLSRRFYDRLRHPTVDGIIPNFAVFAIFVVCEFNPGPLSGNEIVIMLLRRFGRQTYDRAILSSAPAK